MVMLKAFVVLMVGIVTGLFLLYFYLYMLSVKWSALFGFNMHFKWKMQSE